MSTTGGEQFLGRINQLPPMDEDELVKVLTEEIRVHLRFNNYFRNYKRGKLVIGFTDHGRYSGVGIVLGDN